MDWIGVITGTFMNKLINYTE